MHPVAEQALRDRYPALFAGVPIRCGSGWFPVLDYFGHTVREGPAAGSTVQVTQVKVKFGHLRIYLSAMGVFHLKLLDVCLRIAECTCEICGEPGEFRLGLSGPQVRCDLHEDYRTSDEGPNPPLVEALITGKVGAGFHWARSLLLMPPPARLSRFRKPGVPEEARSNRERFLRELQTLVENGSLSVQLLGLLCVAAGALEISLWFEEFHQRLSERTKPLATAPAVREELVAILRSWDRQGW